MEKCRAHEAVLALGDGASPSRRPFDAPPNARGALACLANDVELYDPSRGGRLIAGAIRTPALARVLIVKGGGELGLRRAHELLGARERPLPPIAPSHLRAKWEE